VGVLVLLWGIEWRLGLAFSVLSVGALGLVRAVQDVPVRYRRRARQASADLYGFLEERLAGTEDVRSSGAVPYTMRRFLERARVYFWAELKGNVAGSAVGNIVMLVITVCTVLAFGWGAYLFRRGEITVGTVFLLIGYTQQLRRPIEQLNRQVQDLANATASIVRTEELFAQKSTLEDGALRLPPGALAVDFEGVTYVYPDRTAPAGGGGTAPSRDGRGSPPGADGPAAGAAGAGGGEPDRLAGAAGGATGAPALRDVTLRLEPGRVLGLLGRTGSGKTTAGRLLFRFFDPTQGTVRLGGLDLRRVRLADVRRRVGVVTQEVQLFHATVRDNLTFFDPEVPDDRLVDALRLL